VRKKSLIEDTKIGEPQLRTHKPRPASPHGQAGSAHNPDVDRRVCSELISQSDVRVTVFLYA
jgi:hypothetical protein